MFEGVDLLAVDGPNLKSYKKNVARLLWSMDELSENIILETPMRQGQTTRKIFNSEIDLKKIEILKG